VVSYIKAKYGYTIPLKIIVAWHQHEQLYYSIRIVYFLWLHQRYSKMYVPNTQNYKTKRSLFIQCQEYSLLSRNLKYQVKKLVIS
jgi:hypothetical protein